MNDGDTTMAPKSPKKAQAANPPDLPSIPEPVAPLPGPDIPTKPNPGKPPGNPIDYIEPFPLDQEGLMDPRVMQPGPLKYAAGSSPDPGRQTPEPEHPSGKPGPA